ncbi:hypothetical protein B484DRAFT_417924 [Ochromonadaceae sp. CCMP2298]|nr:hypothetical protein B484DRAFT_417924 [Ochromonadaceae sp. CCMP2298]
MDEEAEKEMAETESPASFSEEEDGSSGGDNARLLASDGLYLPCMKSHLYSNFLLFCIFYAIPHATVDAVLAFSSAELGSKVGALGGFTLYITYTLSALVMAKPLLNTLGPKNGVLVGLLSLLVYVAFFYLAILNKSAAQPVFILGSGVGGLGAGVLWTAQGSYYSLNAELYASQEGLDKEKVLNNFAAIFAAFYLSFEAGFKLIATAIYLAERDSGDNSWRSVVFGLYTVAAFVSIVCYCYFTLPLEPKGASASEHGLVMETYSSSGHDASTADAVIADSSSKGGREGSGGVGREGGGGWDYTGLIIDASAVAQSLRKSQLLRYMIPYQLCFGLNAGLINTYINGIVINDYRGDGYIGLLNGLATLAAVALAAPYAFVSNYGGYGGGGKWYVMVFGLVCFTFSGLAMLAASDATISQWSFIVPFFLVHGAARGVWENTNKAVIAEYFADPYLRDAAFASVYFASGLAGAVGFLLFEFLSRDALAAVNLGIPLLALVTYHRSYQLYKDKL